MQLDNLTPYAAERAVQYDRTGAQVWIVAVKATFTIRHDGLLENAKAQEAVASIAHYAGEPGASQLLRDPELVPAHPGTDVIVHAIAQTPSGEPLPSMPVRVRVGPIDKSVLVIGARRWERAAGRLRSTPPEPFARLPMRWEYAFGGVRADGVAEWRNPIGIGFHADAAAAEGMPLPLIEALHARIASWEDCPAPAGFGAVAPDWAPRQQWGGTYDDAWAQQRAPLWPDDYDERFHSCAADGMWVPGGLRGGEQVNLTHLAAIPVLQFALPRVFLGCETRVGRTQVHQRPSLDRVIIEPELRRVVMVWRTALRLGPRVREVVGSVVTLKRKLV